MSGRISTHRRIHIDLNDDLNDLRRSIQKEEHADVTGVELTRRIPRTRAFKEMRKELIDDAIEKRRRRKNV